VNRRLVVLIATLSAAQVVSAVRTGQRASRSSRTDLEGIWNSATATPLERPRELADKPFFTPEEAAAWERQVAKNNEEPPADAPRRGTGTYNTFFREFGTRIVATRRTSIITAPADGRIPALTAAAAEAKRRRIQWQNKAQDPEDMGLQDRCLAFATAGPPMLPYSYNSNYQIVQTKDAVVIHVEMIHDARIVRMDGRPHLPSAIRRWMGDSVGHWEGATLVVDTTNFNDAGGLYGEAGGNFGWDRELHVRERFTLLDSNTLSYQFEIDDPTAFAQPWKGEVTMSRASGRIFEYACHEANYSLPSMLKANQTAERE
jgi:hypothetical protein